MADPPAKKEEQSVIFDYAQTELSSSALMKLLNDKLAGAYQDLELVVTSCGGGEFATRASSLMGTWSVSTATDTRHCNSTRYGNPDPKVGGKDGLKIGDTYFDGWDPQYLKSLLANGSAATNKSLFDTATANMGFEGATPAYNSSGAAADKMTIHGGKSSNHAIVFNSAGYVAVNNEWSVALKKAGYDDAANNSLTVFSTKTPGKDSKPTIANLETALTTLRKQLDAHPGEEKALLVLNTHGGFEERTVAYQPGHFGQAGGGALVSNTSPDLSIYADDPTLLAWLQQQLPKPGGGYWADDPTIQRTGPAVLSFSTEAENLPADTKVPITVDGVDIGSVAMGTPTGGDYQIPIPNPVLSSTMPEILATNLLTVGFDLPATSDWFRLATDEDYDLPTYPNLDYGISLAANVGAAVPEPAGIALLIPAMLILATIRRRCL